MDENSQPFSPQQKEFLSGFMEGVRQKVGSLTATFTNAPLDPSTESQAATSEKSVHGIPVSELAKEEVIKFEEHPFDMWERMELNAIADKFPEGPDVFRYKFHGLFFVAPAQNALMLRCRIPGGILRSHQLRGLAEMTESYAAGEAALTTRANFQIREIPARHSVDIITGLVDLGLTAKGSGADNIRNITASPTSGIDPQELIDVRPLVQKLHHRILEDRSLFDLPRKFNIAFDTGGNISALADTNDIGLYPVRVEGGQTLTSGIPLEPGIYFRVLLGGVTGHQRFAGDMGLWVSPKDAVALCVAVLRVFQENGCRTNRKKARLKYLLDEWGMEKFCDAVGKIAAFPILRGPFTDLSTGKNVVKRAHIGIHAQKQSGLFYAGVDVPVGKMTAKQMKQIATLAENFGSGEIRLTVWQNLLIPNIPEKKVAALLEGLKETGLSAETGALAGGVIACTGNQGCRLASSDTKGHALSLIQHLKNRLSLKRPLNIHFTGCPNSCAQHYIGDIGLIGAKIGDAGIEGYHMVLGGGAEAGQKIGRDIYKNVSHQELPHLVERILTIYQKESGEIEDFSSFVGQRDIETLQKLFARETLPLPTIPGASA